MKERPILFSTPMVQAILSGRKTMTRRVMKPQPINHHIDKIKTNSIFLPEHYGKWYYETEKGEYFNFSPYGQIGDRLWVKEKFWAYGRCIKIGNRKYFEYYGGEPNSKNVQYSERKPIDQLSFSPDVFDWFKRPSIFLFRKSARILLEITNIRVERLQDITTEDALNERIS